MLNNAGLLPDVSSARTIERAYRNLANENIVEPIAGSDFGLVETVEVYDIEANEDTINISPLPTISG
jgi:DNA-binding transcriptional regulator YhcF (GntR family)